MERFLTVLAAVLSVFLSFSCNRPLQTEEFRKISHKDSLGRYTFILDLSDSLSTFDVDFYTRIDCSRAAFRVMDDIAVEVGWFSPDGKAYKETVYIPKSSSTRSGAWSREYLSPYRKNLDPYVHGMWQLSLTVPDDTRTGMRGMGVVCTSNRKTKR